MPFETERVDRASIDGLVDAFHTLHERLYTFADREARVELVNFRVTATGVMDKVALPELPRGAGTPAASGERRVHMGRAGFETVPVYRREELRAGQQVDGPAIIDQLDTTSVILAGQRAEVEAYGSLIVTERES